MTSITIAATYADVLLPVYRQYPRQSYPQPAFIYMGEDGRVWADYNEDPDGATVTMDVHHRRTLRWSIPESITGKALDVLLEAITPLLERVHAGHSIEWDGHNNKGWLDDDATAASEEIEQAIAALTYRDILVVTESGVWDDHGVMTDDVRADMTDADVRAVAAQLQQQIVADSRVYLTDIDDHLMRLRDRLRDGVGEEGA